MKRREFAKSLALLPFLGFHAVISKPKPRRIEFFAYQTIGFANIDIPKFPITGNCTEPIMHYGIPKVWKNQ